MADFDSSLPIRTQNNGDVVVGISDATTPSQKAAVNAAGSVQVAGQGSAGTPAGGVVSIQGVSGGQAVPVTGSITVSDPAEGSVGSPPPSTAILTGNLVSSSAPSYSNGNMEPLSMTTAGALRVDGSAVTQPVNGTVTANQGTAAALAGAWPVEITDGSNVLGTSAHPIRIDPTGSTTQPISGTVTANQGGAPWSQNLTQISGASPSASNTLPVQISTGSSFVSNSNPLPVTILEPASGGTTIADYLDSSSVASGSSANHDYTVTSGKSLHLQEIIASASGKAKMEVKIETGVGTNTFNTILVQFNSTATPNMNVQLTTDVVVAAGVRVRITMTNKDLLAQDLYSTIMGFEI